MLKYACRKCFGLKSPNSDLKSDWNCGGSRDLDVFRFLANSLSLCWALCGAAFWVSTLLGNAVEEGGENGRRRGDPLLCTTCVEATWELREFGFRHSPGELEGTGSNFTFYQVRVKAGLGPLVSLLSTETPPWVVMDNLLVRSVIPPQQALSISHTKCSPNCSTPIALLSFVLLCVHHLTGAWHLEASQYFFLHQYLEVQVTIQAARTQELRVRERISKMKAGPWVISNRVGR